MSHTLKVEHCTGDAHMCVSDTTTKYTVGIAYLSRLQAKDLDVWYR